MIVVCDFCKTWIDTAKGRWLFQDDGSYIHVDCIEPALAEYEHFLDQKIQEHNFKLLSKLDSREPFIDLGPIGRAANWNETCEWCGYITHIPSETHVCKEKI